MPARRGQFSFVLISRASRSSRPAVQRVLVTIPRPHRQVVNSCNTSNLKSQISGCTGPSSAVLSLVFQLRFIFCIHRQASLSSPALNTASPNPNFRQLRPDPAHTVSTYFLPRPHLSRSHLDPLLWPQSAPTFVQAVVHPLPVNASARPVLDEISRSSGIWHRQSPQWRVHQLVVSHGGRPPSCG